MTRMKQLVFSEMALGTMTKLNDDERLADDPKVKQNTQVDVEPQPVDTENGKFLPSVSSYLSISWFGQDALENLFSTLRCKNPVPRVLEFKFSLRAATMAQFLRPSKDGSYTEEDYFPLTGTADDDNKPNESKIYVVRPSDLLDIQDLEHESLEYLAGYVVA
ncbi:hypothetical protein HPB51_005066 [Rhipicephalus microplus]|uniref:Uncharacterized protein n=1 Tax=Rhipicephalus microplus TaxID=6941 RepID=A0A9J6DLK1_RHIMP|nr:hypothetical protein HPB51_005066 [Rhipicephalus microplus]